MLLIRKLIIDKMSEGKSRSQIAKEADVSKTAVHNYFHGKAKPEGKSLAMLAKYFRCEIWELVEEIDEKKSGVDFGPSLEDQLAEREWKLLSQDQKLAAVAMLRKLKASE